MSIKKLWGTRVRTDAEAYIADDGLIFYDENDGELRLGDGVTPGGVAISVRADLIVAQRLTPGADNDIAYGLGDETHRWYDLHIGDGGVHYNGFADPQLVPYLPGAQVDDIIPALDNDINLGATDKRFANIYLGYEGLFLADQTTDENINITVDQGTLYIDGAQNLRLGDLVIENTTLKSETPDLDINIGETNDTGFFYVRRKAQFDNTTYSDTEAMVSINASGGDDPLTNFPDTLIQTTGRPNKTSRIIQRAYGADPQIPANNSYAVWGSYAARGTVDSPLPLQAGDILARISANGYGKTGGTGLWGSGGTRIESVALENFTATAKGSKINFYTTPVGQITSQTVASITATGMSAKAMEFQSDIDLANGKKQSKAGIEWDQKGVVNGIASLDNNGKLDAAQIPDALTGAIVFKGTWNAFTNTPPLSDSLPLGLEIGWEFIVEVAGTRNIGDGEKTFLAGDFVIYDGTHWKQVPSGNAFVSLSSGGHITVNQTTGAMTLGSDATSTSTNGTIVARDSSGNFSANIITAALNGNANTANTATSAGKSTNLVGGNGTTLLGSVPYQSAADTTTLLAPNVSTTKKFFRQTGDGTNGAAPAWDTVTKTDVGLSAVENTALSTSTHYIGTTSIQYNRVSAAQTLTGVSIDGSAPAGSLTGTTLASNVVTSSLTALGGMSTIKAGTISAAFNVPKNTPIATQTFTVSGLTTSHKIIITSNTAMPDATYFIPAAWVSATNTVSIQIAHTGGGAFTATFDISYFAWV
jgi:hypothetical protein